MSERARSVPALPDQGWQRRRGGWRTVVLPGQRQKTVDLTTRQQISTHIVNACDVLNVQIEFVCGCDEQQCANEVADVWLSRVPLSPGINDRLTVTVEKYLVTAPVGAPR